MPSQGESPDLSALRVRIGQLMPHWRFEDLSDFLYLQAGYSNDNYHFRHRHERYVIRLPIGTRDQAEWRLEEAFYESPGEVLTPEVVAFDVDTGAMISRWVDGALLIDAPPAPDHLVFFLRTLQQNLAATANAYDPIAQSKHNLQTRGAERPSRRVERLIAQSKWPTHGTRPCHNDFNPWNVIRTADDRWVTLDWESRGNNDPLFDLVTMHQGLGLADDFLPGLCEDLLGQPAAAERIQRTLIGFWVREYAWAFAQWQRANHRDELRAQMALAEEKLTALDS